MRNRQLRDHLVQTAVFYGNSSVAPPDYCCGLRYEGATTGEGERGIPVWVQPHHLKRISADQTPHHPKRVGRVLEASKWLISKTISQRLSQSTSSTTPHLKPMQPYTTTLVGMSTECRRAVSVFGQLGLWARMVDSSPRQQYFSANLSGCGRRGGEAGRAWWVRSHYGDR